MPEKKTHKLFISHAWGYSVESQDLIKMLESVRDFKWKNYGNTKRDPAIDTNVDEGFRKLLAEVHEQVQPVDCVVIASGTSPQYRMWIQETAEIAHHLEKPIVVVLSKEHEHLPQFRALKSLATEIVEWDRDAIISAITRCSL